MSDSQYIDGIYNYCDRWCERCPFTARCRTFALEQEFERAEAEGRELTEADWDDFWQRVGVSFENTPPEWLGEFENDEEPEFDLGIEFEESTDEFERILEERTEAHPLVVRADDYRTATRAWLREHAEDWFEQCVDRSSLSAHTPLCSDDLEIADALAVISWYHTLIAAKLSRAVNGLLESEMRDEPWTEPLEGPADDEGNEDIERLMREAAASDAAGSGKVALIGVERSIGAWTAIRAAHPELSVTIAPRQKLLGWLRVTIDRLLPESRTFYRPGLDD